MSEWTAPEGAVWVCPACGKWGQERDKIGDASCFVNAVLAKLNSLKIENGVVVHCALFESAPNASPTC